MKQGEAMENKDWKSNLNRMYRVVFVGLMLLCISACKNKGTEVAESSSKSETTSVKSSDDESNIHEQPEDSVFISHSSEGEIQEKRIFSGNGDKIIRVYDEYGIKSESTFYHDGKVHFKKFNTKGKVMTEFIKKDGKVVFDTIYEDEMGLK